MEVDDLIEKIAGAFYKAKKEKCEKCKYQRFSKELDKLELSNEVFEELKAELCEKYGYEEKKWTKIFKPMITYVGAPVYATYIANWSYNNLKDCKDFWLGLFLTLIVFIATYILFGGIIATVFYVMDIINGNHKILIRFLQRYTRNRRIVNLYKKNAEKRKKTH